MKETGAKVPWREPKDISEAREIQNGLAAWVLAEGDIEEESVRHIAGVDASITRDGKRMIGVIVILSYPSLKVEHAASALSDVAFPYVPGYLSFREIPVLLKAARQLKVQPDLTIVDGQGIAHPRRLGLASHLGLVSGWRTIGCAKSRLIGRCDPPGVEKGAWHWCLDEGQRVGTVVRTRRNVTPVWVSPGHRIGHEEAVWWVLRLATRYRLPEPVRAAHRHASEIRKQEG